MNTNVLRTADFILISVPNAWVAAVLSQDSQLGRRLGRRRLGRRLGEMFRRGGGVGEEGAGEKMTPFCRMKQLYGTSSSVWMTAYTALAR